MKILISACLLGLPCRYDGASKPQLWVEELARRHELIPMCPEQMGGLPTPRNPSERRGRRNGGTAAGTRNPCAGRESGFGVVGARRGKTVKDR